MERWADAWNLHSKLLDESSIVSTKAKLLKTSTTSSMFSAYGLLASGMRYFQTLLLEPINITFMPS